MRLRLASPLLLLIAAACAGAPAVERPTPEPRAVAPRDPLAAPWMPTALGTRRAQRISVRSHLVSQVGSSVREDSLESTMDLAWSEVPNATPARLAGMVSGFSIRVFPDTTAFTPAGVTLPFSFVAEHADGAMPTITTPDASSCTQPNAMAIQGWRDAWIPLPARIEPGQEWQDSTRYRFCRDGIPLDVEVTRVFTAVEAIDRGGEAVLVIDRTTRQTLYGAGAQFGEPVTLRGEGDGSMRLFVTLRGGVIVDAEGSSTLRVELEGRRRQQVLVQTSLLQITAPE